MGFNDPMDFGDIKGESLEDQGDSFVFRSQASGEPSGGEIFSCSNNLREGGFCDGHNDGGIIIDYVDPPASPKPGAPSVSEMVVTKLVDCSSLSLMEPERYSFVFEGNTNDNPGNTGDGGIIIDFTPGPDDADPFVDPQNPHVDPSDPSADLFSNDTIRPMETLYDLVV
jgi:hypothetical protein